MNQLTDHAFICQQVWESYWARLPGVGGAIWLYDGCTEEKC